MFQCGTFLRLFLYFFNLFHLIEFSWIIQIITASHSNNEKMNEKMIFMLFSIMWGHIQEQTINFEHHVHETWPRTYGRVVFKFYKKQTKTENLETCRDVMISYVEAMIKKLRRFRASLSRTMLTTSSASSRNHETSSEILRFASIVRDNLHETFSNFYHSLHIWYHDIWTSFMIFGLCLLFIEFKNNSIASSWSCFMNKMFKILGPFLDTASH